jgi:predicted nucleic acid-binding protein
MTLLIDTNVAIDLLNHPERAGPRLVSLGEVVLSVVSAVELFGGLESDFQSDLREPRVRVLLRDIRVVPFDLEMAETYCDIVRQHGFSRRLILDRMIAATALVLRTTLLTANTKDFASVRGLAMEAW